VTTIVLAGNALQAVSEATDLAHALQPALIVMEDIDLIAEHRHLHGPQPLLFTLLDAMDGLSSEADVAFLLTSNRPDLLEVALSQRPGRVDLAVEIPRPDLVARRALLSVYAGGLPLSAEALDAAAAASEGATASYFKELIRRSVLTGADEEVALTDDVLLRTLAEMRAESEVLTRALLGGGSAVEDDGSDGGYYTVVGSAPEYLAGPSSEFEFRSEP
jgi:SpoVK/Ycf46/Vps4 family AAA+-type ATPase